MSELVRDLEFPESIAVGEFEGAATVDAARHIQLPVEAIPPQQGETI